MRSRPLTALDRVSSESWVIDERDGVRTPRRCLRCPSCGQPSSAIEGGAPTCNACARWALRCFAQVLAVIAFAGQWCPRCRARRHRGPFEEMLCLESPLDRMLDELHERWLFHVFGGLG